MEWLKNTFTCRHFVKYLIFRFKKIIVGVNLALDTVELEHQK